MARTLNLTIRQGETFLRTVRLERPAGVPLPLSGITLRATIRRSFGGDVVVALTITVTDEINGVFTLSLTAAQTAALAPATPAPTTREVSLGVWDCELPEAGGVTRLLEGAVTLSQEATT